MPKLSILQALLLLLWLVPGHAWAPPIGFSGSPYPPSSGRPARAVRTVVAPQIITPPFMYDPDHSLYDWEINNERNISPCYYSEYYGQWFGNCNLYLTAPGYSITVPNRIVR